MLLYSHRVSPRLLYITEFIGKELFGHVFEVTINKEQFKAHRGPKINYSSASLSDSELQICNVDLLFEKGIREQSIQCFDVNGYKAFFKTSSGDFPFDILAAAFYLLSRYEEYMPHKKDNYGRYAHTNSLAFKEHFVHLPLVNIWLNHLKKTLEQRFHDIDFPYKSFKFLPTYDIDIAYSYIYKGAWRNFGGSLRSLVKGEWNKLKDRISVLQGKKKDPFDSYEWLDALHLYCRVKAYYFFLVARKQKGYDKNIDPSTKALQDLIKYHASGYKIGIHPSWQSGDDEKLLKEEIELLEFIADKKIIYSRQHYLRLTIPESYRKLINLGIQKDHSMGYGSINGFRASVASSFFWYDLGKERTTCLRIYPFCFMDANAYYQQKLTSEQAFEELMSFYRTIKKVNGLMITVWHNNFFGTDPQFTGWREVYEIFLKEEIYWD